MVVVQRRPTVKVTVVATENLMQFEVVVAAQAMVMVGDAAGKQYSGFDNKPGGTSAGGMDSGCRRGHPGRIFGRWVGHVLGGVKI